MTGSRTTDIGGKLIELLIQQSLLYRQLQELAQKQTDLVNGSDPEMLLKILAARQRLIDRLAAVDRQLQPIRDDWTTVSQSLSPSQRHEAQHLIDSVQQTLGEILARDEKDFNTLNSQKQKVSGEIRNVAAGKRVNQAYAQNGTAAKNRFVDTKSE